MDLTPDQYEDLVGAYALDACEPDETEAMERYIAAHPAAAAEVERLREVASGIGVAGASRPPVALRDRLLERAAERVQPDRADVALRRESDRFDALLVSLDDVDLEVLTYNGLTVRELVQHIEAVDRAFIAEARRPQRAYVGPDEVADITRRDLATRTGEAFTQTIERYRSTRAELVALRDALPADAGIAGYGRDDALVIRAFETWTHHDDILVATGRDVALPEPAVMRSMAEVAMGSLPLALTVRGKVHPGRTARLVLDGPGGGDWMVALSPGDVAAPVADVVVRASVVDWCRRVAQRVEPGALICEIDGDEALARDLVDAADAFAGL